MTEVLDRFLSSESRLQAAVDEFMTSCFGLQNLALDDQTTNDDVDRKFNQIRACRNPLMLAELKISESRTLLNNALNRFPPPASMLRLPSELLSRIFRHAVPPWCRHSRHGGTMILLVLTSVCRRWREIVIHDNSLWSHVDLKLADYEDNPPPPEIERLWLQRAGNSPLHIHFICENNEFERYMPRFIAFPQLVEMIIPLASQIVTLDFHGLGARQIVEALTEIRLAQAPTKLITAVYISGAADTGFTPSGHLDPRPLAWPPSLFKGLSELAITDLPEVQCPSLYQLLTILNNCPQLYALRLHQMTIRDDVGAGSLPTAHLLHLRFLRLHDVHESGQRKILSFIRPGSVELHLEINVVENDQPAFSAASTFIADFRVTSLCLWPPLFLDEDYTLIEPYIPFALSVHTIFLPLKIRGTGAINTLISYAKNNISSPRLPKLKCLCLMDGRFYPGDPSNVKALVATYSLQRLILMSCAPKVSEYEDVEVKEKNKLDYREMIQWISQRVPELTIERYNTSSRFQHWYLFLRGLLGIND